MMRALPLVLIILVVFSLEGFSQNIVQDNKGSSSVSLSPSQGATGKEESKKETIDFNRALLKLSTSEKKLEANYYQYFRSKVHPKFVAVSASGEMKNSFTSLFSAGDIAAGTDIKIKTGFRVDKLATDFDTWFESFVRQNQRDPNAEEMQEFIDSKKIKPSSDLWVVANATFSGSKFKLFHPDSAFDSQIEKVNFTNLEIDFGINFWSARIAASTVLVGATIGVKGANNFDDLTESTQEVVTTRTSKGDTITRKVTEKNVVYQGSYKETTVFPVKLDIYFRPHKLKNVAFLLYGRVDSSREEKPKTKLGLGVYFLRKNDLFDPVFGVNVDYKDVFDVDTSDDTRKDVTKLSIGLVARLGLLNSQQ